MPEKKPGFDGKCYCGAAPEHAEHWYDKIRYFCEAHTPWSGHGEHCGPKCVELVAKAFQAKAKEHAMSDCKNCDGLATQVAALTLAEAEAMALVLSHEGRIEALTAEVERLKQHVGAKVIDHAVSCLWPQERCTCVRRNDNESVRQETT